MKLRVELGTGDTERLDPGQQTAGSKRYVNQSWGRHRGKTLVGKGEPDLCKTQKWSINGGCGGENN